jgi:molybdenum cofactor biosynthesis protein B
MTRPARIVTVTVSDTRTAENDHSGAALAEELKDFTLLRHERVPDEAARIVLVVRAALTEADAVVVTGGTGIAPRDVTYEALAPLMTKRLDGFGEAFRRLSWDEIGPRAILSRAVAGVVDEGLVFVLPGSTKAARLGARELIAPVLRHAVDLLRASTGHHHHA